MKKEINIVGGGLLGCITAIYIADQNKDIEINLIESGDYLLSSFDSINLGEFELNNGFHGLELPRAKDLNIFLKEKLNYQLEIFPNNRYLSIENELIPYTANKDEWPEIFNFKDIQGNNLISNEPFKLWDNIPLKYRNIILKVSKRYSSSINNCLHLFVPWFLPNNYILKTNDEGDIFRNLVRLSKIVPKYGFPSSRLFSEFKYLFTKATQNRKINTFYSTHCIFDERKITFNSKDNRSNEKLNKVESIIYCSSSAPILKELDNKNFLSMIEDGRFLANMVIEIDRLPEHLKDISEILVINSDIIEVSRISFIDYKTKNKNYLQIELLLQQKEDLAIANSNIMIYIKDILRINKKAKLKFIDSKVTRKIFFPDSKSVSKALNTINTYKEIVDNKKLIMEPFFSPINMSKSLPLARKYNDQLYF